MAYTLEQKLRRWRKLSAAARKTNVVADVLEEELSRAVDTIVDLQNEHEVRLRHLDLEARTANGYAMVLVRAIKKRNAEAADTVEHTLDVANSYIERQYGIRALGNPFDRSAIKELLRIQDGPVYAGKIESGMVFILNNDHGKLVKITLLGPDTIYYVQISGGAAGQAEVQNEKAFRIGATLMEISETV